MAEPEPDLVEALKAIGEPKPLAGAKSKVRRAGEHLKSLKKEVRTFREQRSCSIGRYTQPDTGVYFLYAAPKPVPTEISTLAGDVLCNLRPALDYLIFDLATLDSGETQDGTQFPICDSPELFKRKTKSWLKGVSENHIAGIEGLQPYKGGDRSQWLAWLRDLSNPDKHRELSVIATGIAGDFEVSKKPQRIRARVNPNAPKSPDPEAVNRLAKKLAERAKPQTDKVTLNIPPGHKLEGADMYVNVGLRFDISFENGLPVVEVLEVLLSQTAQVIKAFEPEFKRT
jgi:hypothetical protein